MLKMFTITIYYLWNKILNFLIRRVCSYAYTLSKHLYCYKSALFYWFISLYTIQLHIYILNSLYNLSRSFLFLFNFNSISSPVFLYFYQKHYLLIMFFIYKNTFWIYLQYTFYIYVVIHPIFVVIGLIFVVG